MKRSHVILAALLGVSGLAAAAIAQSTAPIVSILHTNDAIQVVPYGTGRAGNVYANPAQITATRGYYKSVPATGFTLTLSNSQSLVAFDPAGTLASGYVTFQPNPSDGTEACIFSTAAITLLYPTANTGQTVADAVTTLAANGRVCYLYGTSNATWNRSM